MDTNNEIQSTPHSPDPMWRADSPSGDHASPSLELNHDGLSELQLEVSVTGSEGLQRGTSMNEDVHLESAVIDGNGGDRMGVGVSSSRSSSPALRVPLSDTAMVMDHCGGDKEENLPTYIPDCSMSDLNRGRSPVRRQPPTLVDVHSSEPSTSISPQPPLPDSVPLSSQHDPAALHQPTVKEEKEETREKPSHPPPPKVKMSLRDFALRKKKQREEEMTKHVQDIPSSAGVNMSFGKSEGGGGPNGIQVNTVEQVDEELRNGKAVDLKEDSVDSYQGAFTSGNVVKNEVVDVSGTSSIKPTTINGIHLPQPPSSPPPGHLSTLLVVRNPADTSATYPMVTCQSKQEPIEEPIDTIVTIQPRMIDSTHYAGMYNDSGSILPINSDQHHFLSYSPPQPCQEDGEIGEILDTPLRLPSSLPAAPPAMNRLASLATPIPGANTPLSRGSTSKRADFALTRSASSSQVRHSPPTHPRSFNASPPYRQQATSASTPPPPARSTGVPPTAPRALRQYMSSNRPTSTTPTVMTSSSYPSTTSSISTILPTSSTTITTTTGGRFPPYIPRGPSADRDKVRDIDQTQYARSLSRRDSREGGHAWNR